ncbi:MAG: prepilin-type N-terminal cleavage/methylation domain-containing protein [Candidatus Sumerlaeia bacterium]|nr:prepilin-type N-terminal cleavage/methylation domain-containing protein [Candidatus Sumerlaeia bacterium]
MRRHPHAFTLIELLIVVAVIAVLAAIAVPNFLDAQVRSKSSRVHEELSALRSALFAYYADHREYPPMRPESVWSIRRVYLAPAAAQAQGGWWQPTPLPSDSWNTQRPELGALTTPVAYIGPFIPADIYADWRGTPYAYVNFGDLARLLPEHWAGAHGHNFMLYSFGPDVDQAQEFTSTIKDLMNGPFQHYDPTNGTTSPGDILHFDRY